MTQKKEIKKDFEGDITSRDDTDRYKCLECSCIYDPRKGDPAQGIPPGTPFDKLPPSWRCPECKVSITKPGVFKKLIEKSEQKDTKTKKN